MQRDIQDALQAINMPCIILHINQLIEGDSFFIQIVLISSQVISNAIYMEYRVDGCRDL